MQLILISGLSGSGKSVALKALEDAGFYCVDNLPAGFIPDLARFLHDSGEQRIAITVDARSIDAARDLPQALASVRAQGVDLRAIFLEATTENLVKRFSETRRPHPLMEPGRTLPEAIELEQQMLGDIAELAHRIDTSDVHPNTLRAWVRDLIHFDASQFTLYFQSFGFKHGIPLDADLVFDARALPNPFYDPLLRPLTGRDQPVIDYLAKVPETTAFADDIAHFVERWLPTYMREARSSLTVAIGCTGGQHRSVYLVEQLAQRFLPTNQVLVRHRNLWQSRAGEPVPA